MKIEIFDEFSPELEKIWWNFEAEEFTSPFQSYAWLSHWQNTIGSAVYNISPQIVLLKNEKNTLAVLPMGIRKSLGISILEWLGGTNSDYMGPLISRKWRSIEKDFTFYWEKIIKKLNPFDVIHFQKQREHVGDFRNPFVMTTNCKRNAYAYQVNLKNNWKEHYEKTVNSKLRADSRRQRRRLSQIGEMYFEVYETNFLKKKLISKMTDQKSRRYRETGVWDMLAIPEQKAFYEKLADIQDDHLSIHCAGLMVGETMVATHVGIVDLDTFYYLMPAHEGDGWAKYSPGKLLLEHLMEWSIQNKLKVFDFTGGEERYKLDWCDTENSLFEMLEAFTIKGKIYILKEHTKLFLKRSPWIGSKVRKINFWLKT